MLPDRRVLAVARTVVMTAYLFTVVVLCEAAAWLTGCWPPAATWPNSPPTPWCSATAWAWSCSAWASAGSAWLWALFYLLPAAIATYVIYPAVVEPMVGMLLSEIREDANLWLPFASFGPLVGVDDGGPAPAVAVVLFLGVMVALNLIALTRFRSRDV